MNEYIAPKTFSRRGRTLTLLTILGLIGIWSIWLNFYQSIPEIVQTNFGGNGGPTTLKSIWSLLILPFVFSIAPLLILFLSRQRFTLVNNYPYLINIPGFFKYLYKLPKEKRNDWVNHYFEGILGLGAFLSLYLMLIEYGIYTIIRTGRLPSWFIPVGISAPLLIFVPWVLYMTKLNRDLEKEAKMFSPEPDK